MFADSHETYGAPRVAAQLAVKVDRKTVAASMAPQGLEGVNPRMFTPVTTIPGTDMHHIPDRVERAWDAGALNRVWISDITYLRTGQGRLYLAAVIDAHSRRVIGWAMDATMTTDLVETALRMTHTLRGRLPTRKIVFHADRGKRNTRQSSWPPHAGISGCCSRWGAPASAGTTRRPNRSGQS